MHDSYEGCLGDQVREQRPGRANCHQANQRDRHVPGLRQVDSVLPRPAAQAQSVEQCCGN